MIKAPLLLLLLLPFAFALADQPGEPAVLPRAPQFIMIDKRDIPVEDLAHSFFFHNADSEILKGIISEEGINRLEPELAEHRRPMTDLRRIAPKLRRMCNDLQNAKSGQEFSAVFIAADAEEQSERQASARHILSKLDARDREGLERYLDTRYRQGVGRGRIDSEAMFASGPFPSTESSLTMQSTCDSAMQMESRIAP